MSCTKVKREVSFSFRVVKRPSQTRARPKPKKGTSTRLWHDNCLLCFSSCFTISRVGEEKRAG